MLEFLLTADGTGTSTSGSNSYTWVMMAILAVLVIVVVVMPMFTNKKKEKERQETKDSLCIGDKIKTIGGIVGTIVAINTVGDSKELVLESGIGDNKSTITFDIQALYLIMERGEEYARVQAEKEAQKKAEEEKKAAEAAEKKSKK